MFDSESASGKIKPISELHGLLMSVKEVVVLDIETTGFSPEKHAEIIEIGALRLDVWSGAKRPLPLMPPSLPFSLSDYRFRLISSSSIVSETVIRREFAW